MPFTSEDYKIISKLIDDGNPDEALVKANSMIIQDDSDITAWILKGLAYHARGDDMLALKSFQRAKVVSPSSPWPYYRKAEVFHHLGRLEEALEEIEMAIGFNTKIPDYWIERGSILEDLLIVDEAITSYLNATLLDEGSSWAWFGLARSFVYVDLLDDALEACDRALSIDPEESMFIKFKEYLSGKLSG